MKAALCLALALVAAPAAADSARAEVTPVQKVIQLLTGMLENGKKEKHEEQVQFASYKQFCDDTSANKKSSIGEAEESLEILKADIMKYTADSEQLSKEIAEQEADVAAWSGDIKAAAKVRAIEKADYDATHKDYTESVEALQMAIAVLKKQASDRKQESSMVQVSALKYQSLIPDEAKKQIDAFLAQDTSEDASVDESAPEANAYEFQAHGIIEMLEKLLDKFMDERTTLEKEEMNSRHAFEMIMQDLKAQIESAEQDISEKSATKAKKLQAKANSESDLQDTIGTLEEDKKYLADLTATCHQKAGDFESRQQLRAEELEAIEKAIEIISSGAVAGNAEKHLSLVQASHASLAQLRAEGRSPLQQRVAQYLEDQARHLNSRVLSALAVRVADDPFKKVRKMIKDLIVRLMEEANEEAEHKGWCDTELATNEQTRKEKSTAVEELHAEIDELNASIAKRTKEIAELSTAVSELDAAMSEATQIRSDEKAKNAETITDAQDAQTAVAQALVVLKEFYAKAAESTELLQKKQEPEIFDSPYKGMQGESGGVVGMLEVIESDFARLESETKASEATAQKEYDDFMTDSQVDKASKNKDIEHKSAKKQDQQQALVSKSEDLEGTQKELDAALEYFDKLKPSCVDAGVSYGDRVARRKEEIESLQEALKILNGEDIA